MQPLVQESQDIKFDIYLPKYVWDVRIRFLNILEFSVDWSKH